MNQMNSSLPNASLIPMKMIIALHSQFIRIELSEKNRNGFFEAQAIKIELAVKNRNAFFKFKAESVYFIIPLTILDWEKENLRNPEEIGNTSNQSELDMFKKHQKMTEIKNAREYNLNKKSEAGEIRFCIGNHIVPILEINEIDLKIQVKWDDYAKTKPAWVKIDAKNEYLVHEGTKRKRFDNVRLQAIKVNQKPSKSVKR
jgi:hypothetical protein